MNQDSTRYCVVAKARSNLAESFLNYINVVFTPKDWWRKTEQSAGRFPDIGQICVLPKSQSFIVNIVERLPGRRVRSMRLQLLSLLRKHEWVNPKMTHCVTSVIYHMFASSVAHLQHMHTRSQIVLFDLKRAGARFCICVASLQIRLEPDWTYDTC